jgi:hypothetical protein
MDEIYSNAAFNITAAKGDYVDSGLFLKRDQRWYSPCRIPKPAFENVDSYDNIFIYHDRIKSPEQDLEDEDFGLGYAPNLNTLDRRGWTLQESILSARKPIFGPVRLQWSCLRAWASEEIPVFQEDWKASFSQGFDFQKFQVSICQASRADENILSIEKTMANKFGPLYIPVDDLGLEYLSERAREGYLRRASEREEAGLNGRKLELYDQWYLIVMKYNSREL